MALQCPLCNRWLTANTGDTDAVEFYSSDYVGKGERRGRTRKICLKCFFEIINQNKELLTALFAVTYKIELTPNKAKLQEMKLR